MTEYRVTWEIDLEADSPRSAAERALKTQRDRRSIATVFDVYETGHLGFVRVDLLSEEVDDEPRRS